MCTCFIRYQVDLGKLSEFQEYARAWILLISKCGGTRHGYFLPGTDRDQLPHAVFSFPGLGVERPPDVAVALFSFPTIEAYERYRLAVSDDNLCKVATDRFNETKCFSSYERTFLVPIFE